MRRLLTGLIVLTISIGLISFMAGCGGSGNTGVYTPPADVSDNTQPGTGTFKITFLLPGSQNPSSSEDITGSYIPYYSTYLRVTLDGDGITAATEYPDHNGQELASGGNTLTINSVPVGIKRAVIELLDGPAGNTIARQSRSWFMTPAGYSASCEMGVAVTDSTGTVIPDTIEVPTGAVLFFLNEDTVNAWDVRLAGGTYAIGSPLAAAVPPADAATPWVYDMTDNSITFNTAGTHIYDYSAVAPLQAGAPGGGATYVLVQDAPVVSTIVDGDGNNVSTNNTTPETITVTINGSGFGDHYDANCQVDFIDCADTGHVITADLSVAVWSDTQITGVEVTLDRNTKYYVRVTCRGGAYQNGNGGDLLEGDGTDPYYYKGIGDVDLTVQ